MHARFMRTRLAVIFLTAILFSACTPPLAAAERWEYFVPAGPIQDVVFHGDYVWCANTYSLIRWDRRDGSCRQYTQRRNPVAGLCFESYG